MAPQRATCGALVRPPVSPKQHIQLGIHCVLGAPNTAVCYSGHGRFFRHSRHVGAVRVHSWPTRPARLGLRPSGSRRLCRMPRRQADQSVCCAHLRRAPSRPLYGPGQSFGWNRELCVLPYLMASPTQSIFLVSDNFSVDKAPVGAISRFQAGTHHLFGAALHLLSGTAVDTRCHGYAKQEGSHDSPSPTLTLLMWLPPQREMS